MCLVNGKAKLSTPQPPHFPTDLSETQNQGRYPGDDPRVQNLVDVGRREGVCENSEFWRTLLNYFEDISVYLTLYRL